MTKKVLLLSWVSENKHTGQIQERKIEEKRVVDQGAHIKDHHQWKTLIPMVSSYIISTDDVVLKLCTHTHMRVHTHASMHMCTQTHPDL